MAKKESKEKGLPNKDKREAKERIGQLFAAMELLLVMGLDASPKDKAEGLKEVRKTLHKMIDDANENFLIMILQGMRAGVGAW
jgi:hypothetical protein